MIVLDTSILLHFLSKMARPSTDPATGKPVEFARERVEHLVESIEKQKTKIILPTPVISEVLVHAGPATDAYLEILTSRAVFRPVAFDVKAAVELAQMMVAKKAGSVPPGGATRAKLKFDRQIVSIAKVYGVKIIYSDDGDVRRIGEPEGIQVRRLLDCPVPSAALQNNMLDKGSPDR